jgi:hypothetical protein
MPPTTSATAAIATTIQIHAVELLELPELAATVVGDGAGFVGGAVGDSPDAGGGTMTIGRVVRVVPVSGGAGCVASVGAGDVVIVVVPGSLDGRVGSAPPEPPELPHAPATARRSSAHHKRIRAGRRTLTASASSVLVQHAELLEHGELVPVLA